MQLSQRGLASIVIGASTFGFIIAFATLQQKNDANAQSAAEATTAAALATMQEADSRSQLVDPAGANQLK